MLVFARGYLNIAQSTLTQLHHSLLASFFRQINFSLAILAHAHFGEAMTALDTIERENNLYSKAADFEAGVPPTTPGASREESGTKSATTGRPRLSASRRGGQIIRTIVIDKSDLFRAGIIHILSETRFRVIAAYSTVSDLTHRMPHQLCVVLIGLDDDDVHEILATIRSLTRGVPHAEFRIVALAEQFRPKHLLAVIEAGAHGYLIKSEITGEVLVQSLELVLLGSVLITQGLSVMTSAGTKSNDTLAEAEAVVSKLAREHTYNSPPQCAELARLSAKELMILMRLMEGASNKLIARDLNIAESTVKVHVKSLLRKIRVSNRTQAAMWANEHLPKNQDKC
jgi:two-component system, NarL family, nitrate/nitrite response regulator NarL